MRTEFDKESYLDNGIDWPIQMFKPEVVTGFYR